MIVLSAIVAVSGIEEPAVSRLHVRAKTVARQTYDTAWFLTKLLNLPCTFFFVSTRSVLCESM